MTAKKTTSRAKKGPTPAKPVQAVAAGGGSFEPIRIDTSVPLTDERETLFWIDDTEYTVPKKIRPKFAVRVLRDLARTGGDQMGVIAGAVHAVLGDAAMDALAECDHVTDEQLGQIMRMVGDRIRGVTDDMTANF